MSMLNLTPFTEPLQRASELGIHNFEGLRQQVTDLRGVLSAEPGDPVNPNVVRARCLLAEFWDYLGEYSFSARVLEPYGRAKVLHEIERSDTKRYARVRRLLALAAYRRRDFTSAKNLVLKSLAAYARAQDRFGMALAHLTAAKIFARASELATANEHAIGASQTLLDRDILARRPSDYPRVLAALFRARLCCRRGALQEAELFLAEAFKGLEHHDDVIHKAGIQATWGWIYRTRGSFDDALSHLNSARVLYTRAGHRTYLARILNDVANTLTQMGRFQEAESELDVAVRQTPQDTRTPVETKYLRSRLFLAWGRTDEATKEARATIAMAAQAKVTSLGAEARIALGRAILAGRWTASDLGEVFGLLDEVTRLNQDSHREPISRKTEIALNLLQAELQCRMTPPSKKLAQTCYEQATKGLGRVDNAFLNTWAEQVKKAVTELSDAFHIPEDAAPLHFHSFVDRLRFWLVQRAIERVASTQPGRVRRTQVAKLLGVARQSIEKWGKEWKDHNPGRRTSLGVDSRVVDETLAELGFARTQDKRSFRPASPTESSVSGGPPPESTPKRSGPTARRSPHAR